MNQGQVIYDLGANNGDDIPYYLLRAEKVVAVEANPVLAEIIERRFSEEISQGRVILENVAVTEHRSSRMVPFYVHRTLDVLGTTVEPDVVHSGEYQQILVKTKSIRQLLTEHGTPMYIKIDLEGADVAILREIFRQKVFPKFISAEGHDPAVLGVLSAMGGYQRFKIVRGREVGRKIRNVAITQGSLKVTYVFPKHSAGPFGTDIPGAWLDAQQLFSRLRVEGLGWYDIHAEAGSRPTEDSSAPVAVTAAITLLSLLCRELWVEIRRLGGRLYRSFRKFPARR